MIFVINTKDDPETVKSDKLLFGDDTKIMRTITTRVDAFTLQNDIDSLQHWSQKWLLNFNADKCHVLTIGKFENIKHTHCYRIHECELDHVFEEKDLEEHMSTKI